jgi:hypothetical protein
MLGRGNGRGALRFYARHALVIIVVLLIAACSGGGCSSGCSGCGLGTLTRPISTANTIENAGSARITRSGLDFIANNAGTLAGGLLHTMGGEYQYPVSIPSTSISGFDISLCPNGPNASSNPEQCELDALLGKATFHVDSVIPAGSTPSAIVVSGTIPIKLEDLPLSASYSVPIIGNIGVSGALGLGSNGSCDSNANPVESYADIPFTITLPLVADTIAPRVGYTKIDSANVKVNVNIQASDLEVCFNCNIPYIYNLSSQCDSIANGLIGFVFPFLASPLESKITSLVQAQLCTKPNAMGLCPAGSTVDMSSGNCDYDANPGTCLPLELGVDGLLDLGSFLQSISYGTSSQLDFALASGGSMVPANVPTAPYNTAAPAGTLTTGSPADNSGYTGHTPNGVTLGLLGALVPDPTSLCVPPAANPVPTGIPIPTELEQNTITPWASTDPPGPQFGIALSGAYINYALGSVYNSGGLCLGITTDTFSELQAGTLSLLAGVTSLKYLTFDEQPSMAAAAVITRPQQPPTVTIGNGTDPTTDPLLKLELKQFALDFYVWSDDRFIRIFTYTADITVPINLSTAVTATNPSGELAPTLGTVTTANASVTNAELLLEKPATIATGLTAAVGTIVTEAAGAIKPISIATLTSSLGLSLTIPPDGIRKLSAPSAGQTYDFLSIFGDLSVGSPGMTKVQPTVHIVEKEVHADAMSIATYDPAKLPTLHVVFGTAEPTPGPVEYAYWIDQGARSAWSTATTVDIQNAQLFFQGKHTLYVSARQVGVPLSEPETPASAPYLIDVIPPTMTLTPTDTGASLTAWDFVTEQSALEARVRVTDADGVAEEWSEWQPLASLATIATPAAGASVGVEVRDEAGNVASNELRGPPAEVALIRGKNDVTSAAGACGCSTPGTSTAPAGATLFVLFGALGLLVAARRVRRGARDVSTPLEPARGARTRSKYATRAAAAALGVGIAVGALSQGCSCGSNGSTNTDGGIDGGIDSPVENGDTGNHSHHTTGTSTTSTSTGGGLDAGPPMMACGAGCNQACMGALPEGIIGAYTSIAKDTTGTIWVAGYDDSAVTQAYMGTYGDLVVGKYDTTKKQVLWNTVDGVGDAGPGCPLYDPAGWRKGNTTPGADVGLWTSIQLDANDHPIVSYYDATNAALKFASSPDGVTWKSHTVMQAANSDIGRYGKLLVVKGVPVLAFLIMEPGDNGKMRSRVELATGKVATPASAADWTFEDAAVDDDGPCRPAFCPSPNVCIKETGTCSAPSTACGDGAACASGLVCVGGFDAGAGCGTPLASTYIDIYPNAFGNYITMAPSSATSNGVGIVVYDRIHGALVQLAKWSGTWTETVLDSETGARAPNPGPDGGITPAETGDVGVGASLFITSTGDWHVSYVNGTTEALQYVMVPGGTMQPSAPEVVDNGTMLNNAPYPDGQHIVGDDSFIEVDAMGNVTISYQDATAGTLHVATGTPESGVHEWTVLAASQPNEFAGFFSKAIYGSTSSFANFWRAADQTTGEETGNVSFVAP